MKPAERVLRGLGPTRPIPPARLAGPAPAARPEPGPAAPPQPAPSPGGSGADAAPRGQAFYEVKTRIHDRLVETMDLTVLESMPADRLRGEIARLAERILAEEFAAVPLNAAERLSLHAEVQDEVLGLGPLEPLLADPTVADILVNRFDQVYVERRGRLSRASVRFRDDEHLRKIIDRIVTRVGRRVDESSPMVDARLADGSRVNAIIPPLALDGPSLSIRKFSKDKLEIADLVHYKALTPEIGQVLAGVVKARLNVLISGGTGSGKTTMLNALSRFIPTHERIVTIEDAAELQLKQDHVVRLETRPANIEGRGEVTQRDLVKNCLRMRPDRIIVGEVRGPEALDMLQAMNTGHDGSLTTIHANSARDALLRLETMVAMAGMAIEPRSLKRYIASALEVVVQIARLGDGSRKLLSLQEITGMEGEVITMQEIFSFEQTGVDEQGKVRGLFRSAGVRPKFAERLAAMGVNLDGGLFDAGRVFTV